MLLHLCHGVPLGATQSRPTVPIPVCAAAWNCAWLLLLLPLGQTSGPIHPQTLPLWWRRLHEQFPASNYRVHEAPYWGVESTHRCQAGSLLRNGYQSHYSLICPRVRVLGGSEHLISMPRRPARAAPSWRHPRDHSLQRQLRPTSLKNSRSATLLPSAEGPKRAVTTPKNKTD